MSLYDQVKHRDREIAREHAGRDAYFSLSPTRVSLTRVLLHAARGALKGRVLDAGAGMTAYAPKLKNSVDEYIAVDIQHDPRLDAVGSVMQLPIQDQTFDGVFCSQVLEHVDDPQAALNEFYRSLKPGGAVVLSVPHLAYLHNEPHDYFRYTKHGLRVLLERAGFVDIEIQPAGGLLSFLGHIPSVIAKSLAKPIPGLNWMVCAFNAWYSHTVASVDAYIETRKIFALNYVAVARKPGAPHE